MKKFYIVVWPAKNQVYSPSDMTWKLPASIVGVSAVLALGLYGLEAQPRGVYIQPEPDQSVKVTYWG